MKFIRNIFYHLFSSSLLCCYAQSCSLEPEKEAGDELYGVWCTGIDFRIWSYDDDDDDLENMWMKSRENNTWFPMQIHFHLPTGPCQQQEEWDKRIILNHKLILSHDAWYRINANSWWTIFSCEYENEALSNMLWLGDCHFNI